ncbi:phage antirepressor KilAC domain-containing protein [Candidatus Symbiopectobacterium sp. NZEC127]|uniref:phage antirepressor KilAC domain-containing protein n=1 Tax=Candidatus Symbiopectobacterium sp. NZEC127 TaxID=2820472 RepID=UPI002227CB76|nr:phage antirepressor KilAC domain-containing protein [Candidatus Symbiopectobacterium sp. NZEC127]MCW2484860.1 phage antirepressor KilAC domain-containing protein [Candidatus Symbiopectobacterium sp. NZEC127]
MSSLTVNVPTSTVPMIAGVEITTDAEGRFNLNSLHRASGTGESKEPNKWMRNKQAQELIDELSANLSVGQEVVKSVKGGTAPGTFAHELLAIEYAGWISPAFRLQVNQTFIDYRTGKLTPTIDPMQVLSDPAAMRGLLLTYTEKVIALEGTVETLTPKAEALDRIATKSEGSMCITDAAKHLQLQPKKAFQVLSQNHWIYKRAGGKSWLGYQEKIQRGLLEHKVTTVSRSDGSEKMVEQVLITAKGLTQLSEILGGAHA